MTERAAPLTREAEQELMRRLGDADEEAMRILYSRFARPVYGLGLRLLGSAEAAEELTQDVFLTAWRKADRYDPARGRLSTWLMVIAHNLGVDRLRRESTRRSISSDELESLAGAEVAAEGEALDRVTAVRVLQTLPSAERRLLTLAYFMGLTAREIAETDGIPLGTVKTRIRTALIKLRRAHAWQEEA